MNHKEILRLSINLFRERLNSAPFLAEFCVPGYFVRKRKLSMNNVVSFLMFHYRTSLASKLDCLKVFLPSIDFPRVSRQALSKARQGIEYTLFKNLFDLAVKTYYENVSSRRLWLEKYHLFAIDGSDFEAPGSKSSFEEFGMQSDPKNPDLFWAMALASTMYDVLEDFIVDATIMPQFTGERDLAAMHLSRMKQLGLHNNAIVIFDRGYYSAEMFKLCLDTGCMCLMRLHKSMKLCRLGGDDEITTVTAPDGTPMKCRVLKVTLSTGETEYLITNVMDPGITCEMFRELYFERWKIETKYYEMKEHWRIEEFSGRTALSVRQDFYISMLHANLVSLIKTETDAVIAETARPSNRHKHKTIRAHLISGMRMRFIRWLLVGVEMSEIDDFIESASQNRLPIVPGRHRERKRPTRARKHFENRKAV